jgi:hypothetical protein
MVEEEEKKEEITGSEETAETTTIKEVSIDGIDVFIRRHKKVIKKSGEETTEEEKFEVGTSQGMLSISTEKEARNYEALVNAWKKKKKYFEE